MNAGIYIHVPFCAQKCPYCDFYSTNYTKQTAEAYTAAVCRNLSALPQGLFADTVYFGGGTPSLLPPAHIAQMLDTLRERITLAEDAEITLEANPLTMTAPRLADWRQAGVNRLSVGVQSFDDSVLQTLGRRHSAEQAAQAIRRAQAAGFANLSLDLMLGLGIQSPRTLQSDLERALALNVQHISVYLLKIEPETPFGKRPPALCSEDDSAALWLQTDSALTAANMTHYEISNFARPGFESRHNLKYWQCAPYYGIGPGAHACHDGQRTAVPRDLAAFCSAEKQPETVTDAQPLTDSERIMLGLRLQGGIRYSDYPDSAEKIRKAAKPLLTTYLTEHDGMLSMTVQGWLVSNAVLAHILKDVP